MKKFFMLFALVAVFFLSFINQDIAAASNDLKQPQDEITWYRADFPPVTILQGQHADTGFFDKTMHFLINNYLSGYTHNFKTANFERIIKEFKNNRNVCCPSLYKTEDRERFIAFSAPAMVVLPNGIITSKSNYEKLRPHIDPDGMISLRSLLQDNSITTGISIGRIYSGGIDQILGEFNGKKNVFVHSGQNVFFGLLAMMYKGRIDCLIGYPVEAEYFAKNNETFRDYRYFPIKESTVAFTLGYIGCSNNEWGRQIIKQIDEVVLEHRNTTFINFYEDWLEESTKGYHLQLAHEYFETLPQ